MTSITKSKFKKGLVAQFGVGAVVGASGALLGLTFGDELDLTGAHVPGLIVAAMLILIGLVILGGSFSRKTAAGILALDLAEDDDLGVERTSLRWQGIVTALAGLELTILSLRADFLTGPSRDLLLAALAATLFAQTWFNLKLWRSGDELFRRIIVEAGVIAFIAFQFLLFFWVVGARFQFVDDPSAMDVYVLIMVVYLIGSGIASVRRGYGVPG